MNFKFCFSVFISVIFFFIQKTLNGQENYYSKTFTTESGLPHNHVHSIAQDSTGFIWIATWDGLSRYDGYEFRNYYHNPTDTNSIVYFQASKILVDFQNNVWVNCAYGISRYNRATDNFTRFLTGDICEIALDKDMNLWANTKAGLYRWNYEILQFELIPVELNAELNKMKSLSVFNFRFDNENRLWIIAYDNKNYIYYRCGKFENDSLKLEYIGILENQIYYPTNYNAAHDLELFVTSDSCYWQLGNYGIYKFDKFLKQFLPYPEFNAEKDFAGLSKNDIKSATEKHKLCKPLRQNNNENSKTESLFVESFLTDHQNTVWQSVLATGSQASGLTRNILTGKGFKHFFFDMNPENGLNAIFPVLKDRFGTVWAGPTNVNQIFRMDKNGKTTQVIPVDHETWLAARQPRSFLEDSTGIWIGYAHRLLLKYDLKSTRFTKEIFKTTSETDRTLPLDLVHLKKEGNEIYIFGYRGIYKYHIKTHEIKPLKLFDQEVVFSLYSVIRDDNSWWIGINRSRLIHYDNDFNEIGRYTFGSGIFNIEDIIQGDNNDFWISQLGAGLVHFDKTSGNYRIYTTADGLSNNTCYGLLKDKRGNIWISTNHGISRFNPKTDQFRIFGPEDGLKIDEFNSDNTFLASDGEMFFSGMGGVVSFYPDSVDIETGSQYAAPLLITEFRVSGDDRFFKKAIYETDTFILNKGENNFKVTFACLDFVNTQKIKYRYRLRGENEEFTETDHRNRTINYANLLPGKYRLEIEATNANGEWMAQKALLIKIPPFYYQTWVFRLLVVFIVLGITGYFIFMHNRQLRLKARQQQDELKLESLRGQMNPHFIFNSLNSINYFISQNDRLSANSYIADFSRLIRSILGNMSKDYIPLEKELESIGDYLQLEHLRFSDKFEFEVVIDENVGIEQTEVFPGMVQPFIENAIWHGVRGLEGRKGKIKVTFSKPESGSLSAIIEDDGIGRKKAELLKSTLPGRTSRGIGIILERLRIINQLKGTDYIIKIEDVYSDREETGTRVIVEIPCKLQHE